MQQRLMLLNLTSGAQVLGKVDVRALESLRDLSTLDIDVITPLEIRVGEGPRGFQVGLVPYGFPIVQNDPKTNFTIRFYRHALATPPLEPTKALADMYSQMTVGIQLASEMPTLSVAKR